MRLIVLKESMDRKLSSSESIVNMVLDDSVPSNYRKALLELYLKDKETELVIFSISNFKL
jgi:hypothetical protein